MQGERGISINPLDGLKNLLQRQPEVTLERIDSLTRLSGEKNVDTFSEAITEGMTPLIIANHGSHMDELVLSLITKKIMTDVQETDFNGFLLPTALSLYDGHQGPDIRTLAQMFDPVYTERGINAVRIIRPKDLRNRWYDLKYAKSVNHAAEEQMRHAPDTHSGIAWFPEGTMEGGRKGEDGKIKGMQEVPQGGLLVECLNIWKERGRDVLILPVGLSNTNQIYSPTQELSEKVMKRIGTGSVLEPIAHITVGKPFTPMDVENKLGIAPDPKGSVWITHLMRQIVPLIPQEAQGFYGDVFRG